MCFFFVFFCRYFLKVEFPLWCWSPDQILTPLLGQRFQLHSHFHSHRTLRKGMQTANSPRAIYAETARKCREPQRTKAARKCTLPFVPSTVQK